MSDAIQGISNIPQLDLAQSILNSTIAGTAPESIARTTTQSFGEIVSQGLNQVNQQLLTSQVNLQKLAVGDQQNLHQIMIGLEETRLSFQLFMQVRNKFLEAYQDVMRMQI